jgi:tetratricopeptide (TPR) repeat protein
MGSQAGIHELKSEFNEAYNIWIQILQEVPVKQNAYAHAIALLNVCELDVLMGTPKDNVQSNIARARNIFQTRNAVANIECCDAVLASLLLREGNILTVTLLFEKHVISGHPDVKSLCLEQLANVSHWGAQNQMSIWTIVFLVHSLNSKAKLGIHKALQFLADFFLAAGDEDTAISLFTVALEAFTQIDVHRSRAECMLRLGDISNGHGDVLKAVELWETAQPLFEQSSQVKWVDDIDKRLAGVGENVVEKHRENIARLAELNAHIGIKEMIDNLSDIEDQEEDWTQ